MLCWLELLVKILKPIKKVSTGHFIVGGYTTGIQKYDSSKNLIWTRMAGGSSADKLYDLANR